MNDLANFIGILAVLGGPLSAGWLFPNVYLASTLIVFKLFDWWSTTYILKHGGKEQPWTFTFRLIALFGVPLGMTLDFAIVAVAAWLCYPYWYLLAGLVAWYGYWMSLQVGEVRKSKSK